MMKRIPVSGPWVTQKEIDAVADAAANAWYSNANQYNSRFEDAFAKYIGLKYAACLPSCTSALHLSLAALGITCGDEVIVPDVTWIASAAPITYVGATPVFADIDPQTWCLSAESFEQCITPRTKAVIPVDLYGGQPNWTAVLDVAKRHGIAVIEDAAEAIGSEYGGRKAGTFGVTGAFSFHGSKTLTTGEGGMIVTDDAELFARIQFLRDHGRRPGDVSFLNESVAFKYKMSAFQAAFGLAQLERVHELTDRKREIFSWYSQELKGVGGITMNIQPEGTINTYWMVSIILAPSYGLTKMDLSALFSEQGIDTRPFFSPLSSIPAYGTTPQAEMARGRNRVSYDVTPYGLNLPSGLNLDQESVHRVCEVLKRILRRS